MCKHPRSSPTSGDRGSGPSYPLVRCVRSLVERTKHTRRQASTCWAMNESYAAYEVGEFSSALRLSGWVKCDQIFFQSCWERLPIVYLQSRNRRSCLSYKKADFDEYSYFDEQNSERSSSGLVCNCQLVRERKTFVTSSLRV